MDGLLAAASGMEATSPRKATQGMSCRSSRSTSHFNKQERPMLASRAAQQLDTSHQNKRRGERHEQKLFYSPSAP
jgi:hypothetical protein